MQVILIGPSGIGKGYVKAQLMLRESRFYELVWLTTRNLRPEELTRASNRKHVSHDEMRRLRDSGALAYEQTLYGNLYALTHEELARSQTQYCITEMHIDTISLLKPLFPNALTIGMVPGNPELLQRRIMQSRGDTLDDKVRQRLSETESEVTKIRAAHDSLSLLIEISESNESQVASLIVDYIMSHSK